MKTKTLKYLEKSSIATLFVTLTFSAMVGASDHRNFFGSDAEVCSAILTNKNNKMSVLASREWSSNEVTYLMALESGMIHSVLFNQLLLDKFKGEKLEDKPELISLKISNMSDENRNALADSIWKSYRKLLADGANNRFQLSDYRLELIGDMFEIFDDPSELIEEIEFALIQIGRQRRLFNYLGHVTDIIYNLKSQGLENEKMDRVQATVIVGTILTFIPPLALAVPVLAWRTYKKNSKLNKTADAQRIFSGIQEDKKHFEELKGKIQWLRKTYLSY